MERARSLVPSFLLFLFPLLTSAARAFGTLDDVAGTLDDIGNQPPFFLTSLSFLIILIGR